MIRRMLRYLPHTNRGNRLFWWGYYVWCHRRMPNPADPKRFTDHLYRIKVDGRLLEPLYQHCTDKEHVKQYVNEVLGPGHTPKTYAILRRDEEIDRFELPHLPCVLKPTHASGRVMFYLAPEPGLSPVDRITLKQWLRLRFFRLSRESNYSRLIPKVIVEEFLSEGQGMIPKDYKVFCFDGHPKAIEVITRRANGTVANFYDVDWKRLRWTMRYPAGLPDEPPTLLAEMLDHAALLSAPFPFVRVDFYVSASEVRVGELTFCPNAGNARIRPDSADIELGNLFLDQGTYSPIRA